MHALASKISKEKAGLAGPHRAFAESRSLARSAGNISHPRSNSSPFNLPIHSIIIVVVVILPACCRIKFCIFADVICDFSAAAAPPQHFKVGKHSERSSGLCRHRGGASSACATDEATSPLPSLNSALLLQPPCRFSHSLLLPASCETGESYIVVLSSTHIALARSLESGEGKPRPRPQERKDPALAPRLLWTSEMAV